MKVIEIAFTGFPVTDLKRARVFYEGVLGLTQSHMFGDDETAWIEYEVEGAALAIGNGAPNWKPSSGGGTVGLEVDDFDETIAHLKNSSVQFAVEPFETPVCRMAVILDPDANLITIHKRKPGHG